MTDSRRPPLERHSTGNEPYDQEAMPKFCVNCVPQEGAGGTSLRKSWHECYHPEECECDSKRRHYRLLRSSPPITNSGLGQP